MNDDELLARLKSADPARTRLAPPPDIDRLVEATLHTDTALQSATAAVAATTAGWGRRHLVGLAAAGALLVLGGGVAGGIMANNGEGNGRSAATSTSAPTGALRLTAAGGSAKCMEPSPETLGTYPILFAGTVTSVKDATVTFHVDEWFKGGGAETVVLVADTTVPETLTFSEGEHYIVGAKDGVVPPCGANGASPETIAKFRQAFAK
ncbi:hypothetical protein ABTY96_06430 [Streptomyces sp. NPDC096057]|uniref:hypothetical protein n=1 Tax=Streptomyces sp. NPDC096057 TaxID=3155543 RepID=UPI00331D83F6